MRHGQADGGFDDLGLFAVVNELRAGGGAGAGVAADVLHGNFEQFLEARCDERPGTHVLRFLLDPDPFASGLVALDDGAQEVAGPGIELLDADDGDVALARDRGAAGGQVVVDLAGAEEDAACSLGCCGVVDDVVKMADGQLIEGRDSRLCRSRLLGVMTTSGLRKLRLTWRLSRWKYCDGVDGTATWMFSSAQS